MYVINQYPKISHTFIRREIIEMENQGEIILRSSIRRPPEQLVDAVDIVEEKKTHFIISTLNEMLHYFIIGLTTQGLWGGINFFVSYVVKSRKRIKTLLYFIEAICLAGRYKKDGVEHIHAHFGTNSADVAMFASKMLGVPFSFTIHGADEIDNFDDYSITKKVEQSLKTFCVCSYIAAQVKRKTSVEDHYKVTVSKCGVEVIDHQVGQPLVDRNNNVLNLVIVARICPEKGYFTLLESLRYIRKNSLCQFQLRVIGGGEDLEQVKEKVREFDLSNNILFMGWKSTDEVLDIVAQSDLFVLPSYMEGLPISIMESMMVKTPVLSTYVSGIPELIRHGINGILVPANDHIRLAQEIVSFSELSESKRNELTLLAKESVVTNHSLDRVVSKMRSEIRAL
ncbi:TPA: glycosyltransferase [Vibrio vulnificus]|nr:glycosyltransferase [Vibrio vulnificus]